MRYFPIFIDTKNMRCLIVGAGEVAARKVELLLKSDSQVSVVAPDVCDTVQRIHAEGKIELEQRPFELSDLDNKDLVIVATSDNALNQSIQKEAKQRKMLVNVVDEPELCGFITPAIVDRSPIVIALSSGGVAPVLLRYLRQKLETVIPQNISRLGRFFEKFRETVKGRFSDVNGRRNFWESVMEGPISELVLQGNETDAEQALASALDSEKGDKTEGSVYLIGAGPGDPELLTFKALRLMQKADVVVYDRLVSPQIMEMVRRDAEKVYVGKAKSKHTLPQEEISDLLVKRALQGERVVRLKGGDPFIFGRGGEEIEKLVEHNIDFQVVPGITAANGAASYAGIPLTHRDHAQSVVFATGHLQDNTINLDWPALVQKNQTLVFYMGLTGLSIICEQLVNHGMDSTTPIALVESATTENQKVTVGTLESIVEIAAQTTIKPPTLIIVGSVVSLHQTLNWNR